MSKTLALIVEKRPILIDLEQGRDSGKWFATSKEYPGVEGIGYNQFDATDQFMSLVAKKYPDVMFCPFRTREI